MMAIVPALSWKKIESSHRLMTFIVLTLGVFNFFYGERVPAGGGLGWDGLIYADMVRSFHTLFSDGRLSSYYAQRILPAAVVRGILFATNAPISDTSIIRGFELYNLLLLLSGSWFWKRIADKSELSLTGRWIGFSGIFLNFECSKQAFYYPVLTDVTALFTALLLLTFYLERRPIALFVTTCIGSFAWPVVGICGAFLIIFLQANFPGENRTSISDTEIRSHATSASVAKVVYIAVCCVLIAGFLVMTGGNPEISHACPLPRGLAAMMQSSVMPCSLERLITTLPNLLLTAIALVMLLGSWRAGRYLVTSIWQAPLSLIGLAIVAILMPFFIVKILSNPALANASSLAYLLEYIFLPPPGKFFLTYVSLAVFWGPLVLLIMRYWGEFCIQARRLGPRFVAVIGISLPVGLISEPRAVTIAWPFFVLAIVIVLEKLRFKASFKYVLAILTILYAQFWMKLNLAPWTPPDWAGLQDFPKEVYFMHYGLWMNWTFYLLQLPIVIFSLIILIGSVAKNRDCI